MNDQKLGLFNGEDKPNPQVGWTMYQSAMDYNTAINLNDTVKVNENFYIGKQWEGVAANGLPTPQFNILKRVVGFTVANITTDNVKMNATAMANTAQTEALDEPARVVNEEFEALVEQNDIPSLIKEYARNAAVDGDGCLYTYWDADSETGQLSRGTVKTEIIENTRVFFGNPNDRSVQDQPWIMISTREIVRNAKLRAKKNGIADWGNIAPDSDMGATDNAKRTDDKVTSLLLMWKDEEDGSVWAYEFTQNCAIREPWNLKIRLYPICWMQWDYVQDCYHGQAMITGLIPNQIFINKAYAMSMVSLMSTAFPKVIYDRTRIPKWDNRVGSAIGVAGGDVNGIATIMNPGTVSPQISQFIQLAVTQTEQSLGATGAALGEGRADNTSAIVALQRAAATPTELTKQNLYRSIEALFRIYLEFMSEYYGIRQVDMPLTQEVAAAYAMQGLPAPDSIVTEFDFSQLRDHPLKLKLEAGASSYYSEIASMQTLENLLMNGHITPVQFLERVTDSYVPGRRKLINELKQASMQAAIPPPMTGSAPVLPTTEEAIPTGGGYSALQRAINETGTTEGIV